MADLDVNEALVRKLAKLLEETGLSEIEFEAQNQRIRVARSLGTASLPVAGEVAPRPAAAAEQPAAGATAETVPAGAVRSPIVGTVYVASEPGAPPFVKVGDQVREGQTLMIIEAMKVMNPLPSPRAGTVKDILVDDGDPVEFGEPLLVIE